MTNKIYELKTVSDIVEVVNSENFDNFLVDFSSWLYLRMRIKEANSTDLGKVIETEPYFKWIDDNKNNATIEIKQK